MSKSISETVWPRVFAPDEERTIVLGKLEAKKVVVKRGRVDIGEQHTFKDVYVPVVCCWLNEGVESDVESAKKYALANGWRVLCYPKREDNVLEKAKTDIYGSEDWKFL